MSICGGDVDQISNFDTNGTPYFLTAGLSTRFFYPPHPLIDQARRPPGMTQLPKLRIQCILA